MKHTYKCQNQWCREVVLSIDVIKNPICPKCKSVMDFEGIGVGVGEGTCEVCKLAKTGRKKEGCYNRGGVYDYCGGVQLKAGYYWEQ